MIAGALYPIVLGLFVFLFQVFQSGGAGIPIILGTIIVGSIVYLAFGLFSGLIGFIFSGITGIAAISLVYMVNTSIGNPMPKRISARRKLGRIHSYRANILCAV